MIVWPAEAIPPRVKRAETVFCVSGYQQDLNMQRSIVPGLPSQWMLVVMLISGLTGCGESRPRTYATRGRVVFSDGQPVKTGTVELLSQTHGSTATGRIQSDGSFVLGTYESDDGACEGDHQAIISQMMIFDGMARHQVDHGSPVDPTYASYTTSPLKVTIRRTAQNTLELQVEKLKQDRAGGRAAAGTK